MTEATNNALTSYMQTFPTTEAKFEVFELPAENILDGDPRTVVAVFHENEDGSLVAGMSRFSEGTWRIKQDADEINYVTKGRMIITSDRDDREIVCTAGSTTRLDRGVVYTKTVVEPYEEMFVMVNSSGVQM